MDNFSARAMTAMGFGFAQLEALNSAIIQVAMPGYGLSGPYRGSFRCRRSPAIGK
jgi:crotonobetainyl-CoA:carnitine CoA-transferase CaiB-like acyl-CoA transferase